MKKNENYTTPDVVVIEIELEETVLTISGYSNDPAIEGRYEF